MVLHANVMETELGLERRCTKCGDYWPEDREFWFIGNRKDQKKPCIQQPCKACYYELPSVIAKRAKRQRSYRI
jgi:hypothetical protein